MLRKLKSAEAGCLKFKFSTSYFLQVILKLLIFECNQSQIEKCTCLLTLIIIWIFINIEMLFNFSIIYSVV